MVTMAEVVEGNDEQQKSGSLSAAKEIVDPVVYKLVRVDGDGRIVPATDDEVMEVDEVLFEENNSELPLVADTVQAEGCIVKDGLVSVRNNVKDSEGISTNAEVQAQKLKAPLEDNVPLGSHAVDGKCGSQVGLEMCMKPTGFLKLSGSSSLVSASMQAEACIIKDGLARVRNNVKGSEGISTNAGVKVQKLKSPLEDNVPLVSHGVNDKCSTKVGVEMCLKPGGFLKLSGSSSLASATVQDDRCILKGGLVHVRSNVKGSEGISTNAGMKVQKLKAPLEGTVPLVLPGVSDKCTTQVGGEIRLKPSSPSVSTACSRSMPDFSKIKGEVCLDNLTVKELHETFRATFGRETTIKDKLWLKRRIAMGLTNSCNVATSTFIIKDKTLIRREKIEGGALCEIKCSESEDQIDGIFKGSRKDSLITPINRVGDEQVSGKRLRKSDPEDEYISEDPHNEHTKRVRKPTKRYIEELSEVDNSESSAKPVPSVKSSGNCHSDPKPKVRPLQSVGLDRPVVVTRQESFGGSGVQVPYVSRVRRGRPRENFMPLMKFHPGSMGADAKPVSKNLDVCVSKPDSENGDEDLKAKLAPQQSEQPIVAERKEEEKDKEDKENHDDAKTCISVEQQVEVKDLAGDNSDHNVKTQSTTKGEPIRKHHRAWTLSEVTQLVEGVSRYGAGRWSEIKRHSFSASSFRTSVDLKDKWRNLLRASFAHSPAVRDMLNSKKQATTPIPANILLRVRELAEKYSQVPPPDACRKVRRGGGLSRKAGGVFGRKIVGVRVSHKVVGVDGGVSGGSSVGTGPIVNETRSGFL